MSRSTKTGPLPSKHSRLHDAIPSCPESRHVHSHKCTLCSPSSDASRSCAPRSSLRTARAIPLPPVLLWRCSREYRAPRMDAVARHHRTRPTYPVVRKVWNDGRSRDVRAVDHGRRELTGVVDQCLVYERRLRAVRPTDEATRIRKRGRRTPGRDGVVMRRYGGATERGQCPAEECRATFDASSPREGDVRYCNRAGPDGGHSTRWDGTRWQAVSDRMEHEHA